MSIIKKAIKKESKLNLICNCYNPLKMCVVIIDLAKIMNKIIDSPEELNSLKNEIEEIMLSIISDVEIPGILRYWLYDDINKEFKVIDLLAFLDFLSILNHPKIVRTVDHIWRGTYDCGNNASVKSDIINCVIALNIKQLHIHANTFTTMIGCNKNGAMIKYTFMLAIKVIKNSFKFKRFNHTLLKTAEKIKLPTYGYVAYTNSIYLKIYIDLISLILFYIAVCITLIYETHYRAQMEITYATITNLQAQTQTTSVLSSIETNYATLQSQGEAWHSKFIWMIILNAFFGSCFIQESMILILSFKKPNLFDMFNHVYEFAFMLLTNMVHFAFALLLVDDYNNKYDISRTLERSEEKYYRMMLSTSNGFYFGSNVIFNYLVFLLGWKILYQLVYFPSFGVLVQIIFKMLINSIKFLLICLIFIILFTVVANASFYDISGYSSFYDSFFSMYSSALGGFDFSVFDSSSHVSYYSRKILIAVYLLISVVMLTNFLIAILSDTYSFYLAQAKSLQMKKIIFLRTIYEFHPYLSCLVRAPLFLNAYLILLCPFVLIFKSKKLNNGILFLEHLIVVISYIFFHIFISALVYIPALCILMYYKLKNIIVLVIEYGPINFFVGIADFFVTMLFAPFCLEIVCITHIVGETLKLYQTNIIKTVEVYKDENLYIHNFMDVSLPNQEKLEKYEMEKIYFKFKQLTKVSNSIQTVYDPSNCLLSEVVISIIIATLKMVKREFKDLLSQYVHDDSTPLFVPTKYVILELKKSLFIDEQLRSMLVGPNYKRKSIIEDDRFEQLIYYLADSSLGGTDVDPNSPDLIEDSYNIDTGLNYILLMACMKSHEERRSFWRDKLITIFTECSEQWILDHFNYAKIFLYLNSFEEHEENIKEKIIDYISKRMKSDNNKEQMKMKIINNEKQENVLENIDKEEPYILKIKNALKLRGKLFMIDIPNLLYPISAFEKNARKKYKIETSSGTIHIKRDVYDGLIEDNKYAIQRFISSKFSSGYRGLKNVLNRT